MGSEERFAHDAVAVGLETEIETAEVLAEAGIAAALANKLEDGRAVMLTDVGGGRPVENEEGRADDSPTNIEVLEECVM